MPLRLAIAGASGRMGRCLIEGALAAPDLSLAAALELPGSGQLGQDAGAALGRSTGVAITADIPAALAVSEVLIDFTRPAGTLNHLAACRQQGVAAVVGTTGLDEAQKASLRRFAEDIPIVFAPNMSVGVNLMIRLLEIAAKTLPEGYDIEIIEAHHRHKVDAPSGTALRLGEAVAGALGRELESCAVYGRQGVTGERDPSTIGFATVRAGDIVGEHTVMFAGIGERLEITHKASSRMTFAQGALRAARFLAGRPPGLYDMADVLGLPRG
ncbi:4-hydroxy-tetrahydrodipicolinate reductase [Burkholderiales bacterium]|nr:MAG: 4-hydroxy-tetrahydrodipicolinate reductase [Burkholderiales bacterium]CAG0954548.1 4-hydroxy-tetrahydrodipicolinate reductase [Burkholderiales bacterium]